MTGVEPTPTRLTKLGHVCLPSRDDDTTGLIVLVRCQIAIRSLDASENGHEHEINLRGPRSRAYKNAEKRHEEGPTCDDCFEHCYGRDSALSSFSLIRVPRRAMEGE